MQALMQNLQLEKMHCCYKLRVKRLCSSKAWTLFLMNICDSTKHSCLKVTPWIGAREKMCNHKLYLFFSLKESKQYSLWTKSQIVNFLKGLKAGILAIFPLGHKNDHQREKKHCYNSCKKYILLLWKTKQWTNKKFDGFLA